MPSVIDTDRFSALLRSRSVDLAGNRVLLARLTGSEQEQDLTEPVNCGGIGRIRHFKKKASNWPSNPLPIEPALRSLAAPGAETIRAQVFQIASCNWRCWYCYVPFSLLAADPNTSEWLTASETLDRFLREPNRPAVIDLSGGQPDLVPEWILWFMREIEARGLKESVYLWSDDNLSNDYFWTYLSEPERRYVASFRRYGKVCCFKGFDNESFSFNTSAESALFSRQIELMSRHLQTGVDIYAYITLTTGSVANLYDRVARFLDSLQGLHSLMPLRMVPLEVREFRPATDRLSPERRSALVNQYAVIEVWIKELSRRFSREQLELPITDVQVTCQQ